MQAEGMAELASPTVEETTPVIAPTPPDRWPPFATPKIHLADGGYLCFHLEQREVKGDARRK